MLLKFDSESHLKSMGKIARYTLPIKKPHIFLAVFKMNCYTMCLADTVLLTSYLLQIGMTQCFGHSVS